MPADASIYSQIRPFTMDDPISQAAKAMQVKSMGLQIQDQERKFTLEDDISGALSESGGDLRKASNLLAQRGRGTAALQVGEKAGGQEKAQLDQKLKLMEAVGSDGIALDAAYRDALAKSGGNQQAATAAVQPVYSQVRARWKQMGHELPENFDPVQNLAGIGQAKEVASYLKGLRPEASDLGKLLAERDSLPAGDPRRANYDSAIGKRTEDPTELARLFKEREAIPEGDPRRATYDRVLSGYKAGKGDTQVTVNTGPMTPGKQAGNKIDEDMLGVTRNLMQLDTMASQWRPEYQRFQDKAGYMALKVKDSTVGLTNKEKTDLTAFSQYRRNAFNTLNEYIKSVTGAAMSEAEAQRILKGMPNPGEGLFDGDSPTEFKAKLDDAMGATKKAVARLSYLKRNGMSLEDGLGKGISLDKMPELMNQRGQEIEKQLKQAQPNATKDALGKAVRRQLSVEFGLSSD